MIDTATISTGFSTLFGGVATEVLIREGKREKSFIIPRYDMHRVIVEDKHDEIFEEILRSSEGMREINLLKNEKAEQTVNLFLDDFLHKVHPFKKQGSNVLLFITKEIRKAPLINTDPFPSKSIGLTKKEVWKRFRDKGLIEKFIKKHNL